VQRRGVLAEQRKNTAGSQEEQPDRGDGEQDRDPHIDDRLGHLDGQLADAGVQRDVLFVLSLLLVVLPGHAGNDA